MKNFRGNGRCLECLLPIAGLHGSRFLGPGPRRHAAAFCRSCSKSPKNECCPAKHACCPVSFLKKFLVHSHSLRHQPLCSGGGGFHFLCWLGLVSVPQTREAVRGCSDNILCPPRTQQRQPSGLEFQAPGPASSSGSDLIWYI